MKINSLSKLLLLFALIIAMLPGRVTAQYNYMTIGLTSGLNASGFPQIVSGVSAVDPLPFVHRYGAFLNMTYSASELGTSAFDLHQIQLAFQSSTLTTPNE